MSPASRPRASPSTTASTATTAAAITSVDDEVLEQISGEGYAELVDEARAFLKGRSRKTQQQLVGLMDRAAADLAAIHAAGDPAGPERPQGAGRLDRVGVDRRRAE